MTTPSQSRAQPLRQLLPVAGVAILIFSGCLVGPDYQPPEAQPPSEYRANKIVSSHLSAVNKDLAAWWQSFNDPLLDSLIEETLAANHDLRLARTRVQEARLARQIARSSHFPQLDASVQASRARQSDESLLGTRLPAGIKPIEDNLFRAGLETSWELDLFGGIRRAVEVGQAEMEASEEARRGLIVLLVAEMAGNYSELRGLQKLKTIVEDHLRIQKESLDLTQSRFRAGLSPEADLKRAEAQVARTKAELPGLESGIQRVLHRISVLMGQPPGMVQSELEVAKPIPSAPPRVPVGLPSDLLRERPDIRQAEREWAAATARIGQAKAGLFPRFFLTGAAGLESVEASDLISSGARFWSLGPAVKWPLFQAGRLRRNIEVQTVRQEQTLIRYEQTLFRALEEVENALIAYGKEQERYELLANAVAAHRRSLELARDRYQSGLASFLEVLDAERALLDTESQQVRSETELSSNFVGLFKALGGGWQGTTEVAAQ